MKRYILFFLISLAVSFAGKTEQWRLHPTYTNLLDRIIETPDYTWLLCANQLYSPAFADYSKRTNSLYRYYRKGEELLWLSSQNKLSSSIPVEAEYDFSNRCMIVCFDDGDVNLVYDNGDVKDIPGLKIAEGYNKNIWSVTAMPDSPLAYLSTDFGYFTVDGKKGEIVSSVNLGRKVNATAEFDGVVFVGCEDGVYTLNPPSDTSLLKVSDRNKAIRFAVLGNRLYLYGGDAPIGYVGYFEAGDPERKFNLLVEGYVDTFEPGRDNITFGCLNEFQQYDREGNVTVTPMDAAYAGRKKALSGQNGVWVDMGYDGVHLFNTGKDAQSWSPSGTVILPNASNAFIASNMAYSDKYGMLVRNHGLTNKFENISPGTPDLISGLKDMEWTPYSATVLSPGGGLSLSNPAGLAIDPNDKDMVYCGSVMDGLLALNMADVSKSYRLGRKNDAAVGEPGLLPVFEPHPSIPTYYSISTPYFDAAGNMWTTHYDTDNKGFVAMYWTPEARKATNSSGNYMPFGTFTIPKLTGALRSTAFPLRAANNRNKVLFYTRTGVQCMMLDHNGTLDNRNDDKETYFNTAIYDQYGSLVNTGYYNSFFEEPASGRVWLGCMNGVFYFDPAELNKNGDTRLTRPIVRRNDGTNIVDFLLNGVTVNVITSDNLGRKWFATEGAGLICTSATGEDVIKSYTTDNSEIPSNQVYGICYNPVSNSMMVSTDSGLAELFLSSPSSEDGGKSDVTVYPNPVRPDYYGYVTIEGLEPGALVKIMDSAGNMVKEVGLSYDGSIQWDVTNFNNKRVRAGVYYVLASSGPENEGFAAVGKVLVIN